MIIYGIKVFSKIFGYYGEVCECPHCHAQYKSEILRVKKWIHIMFIPLIPIKTIYYKVCPRCLNQIEITKEEAKRLLSMPDNSGQKVLTYAKNNKENNTYEIWTKDTLVGTDTCVINNLNKTQFNNVKKNTGHKEIIIQ